MGNFITKVLLDCLRIGESVFNYVVQQSGGNGNVVEPHVGKDVCDLERMNEIRFARSAFLTSMLARRK